ncbi:outer membrane protein assembly factor BamB family protein [Nocardiopsis deserti]|uniref:outer membrane protein assembly factor BamB family protein n=1 Tax=Nocardiopsis deserti TaxID=2605988 RepID=UPI00123B8233|nr:PQQ-binding-like beta-propeller repeat protein [Nocardiopsis deserti]
MRRSRVPRALTCGLAVLLATACTGDPEPSAPPPEEGPAPVPTAFEGEAPPGIEGEVLRHLHGGSADVHEIFADPLGVRISPVGGAFLVSSGSEDRHLLHDAATGGTLWEGAARFDGFGTDRDGERVLLMADADGLPFVLDARGERLWEPAREGDTYLDGLAVRRPGGWTAEEPHGAFALLDGGGDELWEYEFEAPAEPEEEEGTSGSEEGTEEPGSGGEPGEPALGVPVAARDDLVLLATGGPVLHARSVGADTAGEELWTVDGEDGDLGLPTSAPAPAPQVIGFYALPEPGSGTESPSESASEDTEVTEAAEATGDGEGAGEDEADGEEVLLLRWAQSEAPSTLSAHDPDTGDLLWTLEEPGTNPVAGAFDPDGVAGSLYDGATGTLLLPQASGGAPVVAVDLAGGEVLWGLEEEAGSISPAFAFDGLVYGDSRASGGQDRQLVLDAVTMDVVEDELPAYVEAVTESGHAILVHDRQRFVYGPLPDEPSEGESGEPSDAEGSGAPGGEAS